MRDRSVDLTAAGLPATGQYAVTDVLDNREISAPAAGVLAFHQPPHSVRVLKIVDAKTPLVTPSVTTDHPSAGNAGDALTFAAHGKGDDAALSYHWDFGDGVSQAGSQVKHTYTEPGDYEVHVTATGLGGRTAEDHFQIRISGHMPTTFNPERIKRQQPSR